MKRGTRKTVDLSDSVHRQLSAYALAASAAGLSLLVLSPSSEAKIVYTATHQVIAENNSYLLALNHKTIDFIISNVNCISGSRCNSDAYADLVVRAASQPWAGNEVVGTNGNQYLAAALKLGSRISGARRFIKGALMVSQCAGDCLSHSGTRIIGQWSNVTNRYLGLKFKINGKFHYGWARLNVKVLKGQFKIIATLTGYAYETILGKSIIAGQTKGTDDAEPVASLQAPAPEPAALGMLALGAPGLWIWRREESAVVKDERD